MNYVNERWNRPVTFSPEMPGYISHDEPLQYRRHVLDLIRHEDEGSIPVYSDTRKLAPSRIAVLTDPFRISMNDPKILKGMLSKLARDAYDGPSSLAVNSAISALNTFIADVINEADYPLVAEKQPSPSDLLKIFGLAFDLSEMSFAEHLEEYLLVRHEYATSDVFILCGFRQIMSEDEVHNLVSSCMYRGISLLFVDCPGTASMTHGAVPRYSNEYIEDGDECIIVI